MFGTGADRFAPDGLLTRGMAVTVLYRLAKQPEPGVFVAFADVEGGSYYESAVRWAYGKGIVQGSSKTSFEPDRPISRQELAVMLYRYAKSAGAATDAGGSLERFSDSGAVADWAVEALRWAVERGILLGRGDGTLDPAGQATRAETTAMLMRCFVRFRER